MEPQIVSFVGLQCACVFYAALGTTPCEMAAARQKQAIGVVNFFWEDDTNTLIQSSCMPGLNGEVMVLLKKGMTLRHVVFDIFEKGFNLNPYSICKITHAGNTWNSDSESVEKLGAIKVMPDEIILIYIRPLKIIYKHEGRPFDYVKHTRRATMCKLGTNIATFISRNNLFARLYPGGDVDLDRLILSGVDNRDLRKEAKSIANPNEALIDDFRILYITVTNDGVTYLANDAVPPPPPLPDAAADIVAEEMIRRATLRMMPRSLEYASVQEILDRVLPMPAPVHHALDPPSSPLASDGVVHADGSSVSTAGGARRKYRRASASKRGPRDASFDTPWPS